MTFDFSEKEMVIQYCKILESKRVSFAVEVPFYYKSIDLVYFDPRERIIALEFKISNWRKAIRQAEECSYGADEVYVCLPEQLFNENIEHEIKKSNCGLIIFNIRTLEIRIVVPFKKKKSKKFNSAISLLRRGIEFSQTNDTYARLLAI